jgi:hypothetical protein
MNGNELQSGARLQIDGGGREKIKTGDKGTEELERDTIPKRCLGTSWRDLKSRAW